MSTDTSDIYSILGPQMAYVESLSPEIKSAIVEYTDTAFRELNRRLRNGIVLDSTHREMIELLDDAFDGVPVTKNPITVYRGISGTFVSDIVSYISASYDPNVAKSFSGKHCCRLKILIPAGSAILPIETISNLPHEQEILLPRFGEFIVTNTGIDTDGVQTYDLVYIPENSVVVTEKTNLAQIPNTDEQEQWISRIIDLANPDELELFGADDLVDSIVTTSLAGQQIPKESIKIAKLRLQNINPV